MLLSLLFFFLKWHSYFLGFVFAFVESLYHISPLQCHFQKFAGVAMKCTLHCHSILTTPLPLRSGNAVLICIFATHSNATPVSHSNATPKVHFNATPECTLHCHSITTTPMPLSQNTPMLLRSVFGVLICIFATHSYTTPMPLQYHSIRLEWHRSVHSGLWK